MGDLTLFRAVLTTVAVLLLAYWCSRLLGKQWVRSSGSGRLQIIEQIQVGQNQRILLLRTGEKNYLIGVSQAGIQMLAEVEGDFHIDILPQPNIQAQAPFQDILDKYLTLHQKKKGGDK